MVKDSIEQAKDRLLKHAQRMMDNHAQDYELTEMIRSLKSGPVFQETLNLLPDLMKAVQEADRNNYGLTKEKIIPDYYLAVSYFNTNRFPVVGASFPGGYFTWLMECLEKANQPTGKLAFAHWIFLVHEDIMTTHFSLTKKDITGKKIFAWDFFNPSEMQEIFKSDPRDADVKRQWQI